MICYLQLIRFKNLLLLVFMQLVFRYGFLKLNNAELALTDFQFGLLILATILLAAGGYVIHAILHQDINLKRENKERIGDFISENAAYNTYFALNISAVFIGYYLSNAIQRPSFLVFFILVATLLYFYSSQLKFVPVLSAALVALLSAFSIVIIGFFDLFPATDLKNQALMRTYFSILTDYATMALLIVFIIELIKEIANFEYNFTAGNKNLAVTIGIKNTKYVVIGLLFIAILLIYNYINNYLMINNLIFAAAYGLLFLIAPLIYAVIRLFAAKSVTELNHLNFVLKAVVVFGIISVFVITKNILYHVTN